MKRGQRDRGDEHHRAVQDDEVGLVLHDGVRPAPGHLGDAVAAAGEDGREGEEDGAGEEAEAWVGVCRLGFCGQRLVECGSAQAQHEVRHCAGEAEQDDDLQHDAGHHEVVADFLEGGRGRGGGDGAAAGLEDECEEVAADEDPGVEAGFDFGVFGPEGEGDVF